MVSLAVRRGAHVLATAGPSSIDRVKEAGASTVVDYHEANWPEQILEATAAAGVDAVANAARGSAGPALLAVRDAGRFATITSDAPEPTRGIEVASVYVRPNSAQLELAIRALASGNVAFKLGARFPLSQAQAALTRAVAGLGGSVVLEL
jgi:NADPH:quinone reductase-like Zn-dependent oxidoreductase